MDQLLKKEKYRRLSPLCSKEERCKAFFPIMRMWLPIIPIKKHKPSGWLAIPLFPVTWFYQEKAETSERIPLMFAHLTLGTHSWCLEEYEKAPNSDLDSFYCICKYSGNVLGLSSSIKPLKSSSTEFFNWDLQLSPHFNNIYVLIINVVHCWAAENSEKHKKEN